MTLTPRYWVNDEGRGAMFDFRSLVADARAVRGGNNKGIPGNSGLPQLEPYLVITVGVTHCAGC